MTRTDQLLTAGTTPADVAAVSPSRAWRITWVTLVLAAPLLWGAFTVVRPSDSTLVYASSSVDSNEQWNATEGVIVRAVYGDSPLAAIWSRADRAGDTVRITAVDGVSLQTWARRDAPTARVGDTRSYSVQVGSERLPDPVQVTLGRYPLLAAATANSGALALWIGLAAAGSFVFWRRARDPAARTLLALAAFVPLGMTAFPLGLQVIDFAGGRGVWPYVVGEVANCLAWGSMLFFAFEFPAPMRFLQRHPWLRAAPFIFPFALYAAVSPLVARTRPPGLAREEVLVLLSAPSALLVLPLIAITLIARTVTLRTSADQPREHQLALRVVLLTVLVALVAYVAMIQLPRLVAVDQRLALAWAPIALLMPLAGIVVAVTRYRLYEVDLIVRRSLLAVLVALLMAVVFVGLSAVVYPYLPISGLGQLLAGGAFAAVLLPLGWWLWRRINRWVFGARDDPHRVVSDLRGLGTAASIEESLTSALTLLSDTLRLVYAAIEVDAAEGVDPISVAVGRAHRRPTVIELMNNGHPWGRLTLGVSAGREQLGPRDRRLLDNVGAQVGALVQGLVMNQALRRSRERVITAREEERRRIRRDLHDGLGPALATQGMQLEYVRDILTSAPDEADQALGRLVSENEEQIHEIRRLVDDLRPRTLDQFGLVTALRQQAAGSSFGAPDGTASFGPRAPLRWSVNADDVEPLPAAVEVAAYRIVLEAVNNAAKHSNASTCQVTLTRDDDTLAVMVVDNGIGLPHSTTPGVGLGSMRERAEELGGVFDLVSNGSGTTVTARLPLEGG